MKKTIEQIQEWLKDKSLLSRDLEFIMGYLYAIHGEIIAFRCNLCDELHASNWEFIKWYNEEE